VVSRDLKDRLVEYGVSPSKIQVIHLGIDPTAFDPNRATPAFLPDGRFAILYPHRLTDQKDPLLMVTIMAALRDEGSTAVVHVVGDGELRGALETAIDGLGLRDRVFLHGARAEMAAWYRATGATLLTSRFEGIPLVAYEAMAMQRPVVAPDVNGTGELVDEASGFLIRPRDSVPAYVAALRRLECEAGLAERLGTGGRQRILDHFTLDRMARAHEALYHRLTADRLAAGP
jgi:glycogen synthase